MCLEVMNCITFECRNPEFSRDKELYYHKSNGCGLTYELGTHLFQDRIICMNSPFKYGANNDKG